ncbi:MAG: phosphate/phosphite/phosphonate ABC transporter substrate-binding protein [Nitrospirae bacterium]|nr:phosphate/phosphite/phosphonate ABC transporter substrate-binding protein [Nitrospirota bacterium]
MNWRYWIILLAFPLVFLAYAGLASAEDEILIGLIPEENIFKQMDRHRPLAEYLSKKLGIKVRFTILSRYGDVLDRFMSRRMDGAFFGVFTGVLAMEHLDAEPIVHPVSLDGTSAVQSYIFARKDSNIRSIADMKGRRIAFVDKVTVTGYLYALSFIREHGVKDIRTFFSDISFTGSHGSTIYAVLDGRADIGTAKSRIFNQLLKKDPGMKEELTIIAKSREFPDATLFLRKDLPAAIRSQIRTILVEMDRNAEGKEVLKKLEAQMFIEARKSDFRPFYEVVQKAGIIVKTYKYR